MATQLPHYLRPPEEWTAENVTARDVVVWRDIVVSAFCEGCRVSREMNVWRIGAPGGRSSPGVALSVHHMRCVSERDRDLAPRQHDRPEASDGTAEASSLG